MNTVAESFRDVDASKSATRLIDCLDTMNALEPFIRYKARSLELLDLAHAGNVVDVACGVGYDAINIAKGWPGVTVVGVDHSRTFLDIARSRSASLNNLDFVQADAKSLGFPERTFDRARVDRSLQHIENPVDVLLELKRVVRPGGKIVISEPDWATFLVRSGEPASDQAIADQWRSLFVNPEIGGVAPRLMRQAGVSVDAIEVAPILLRNLEDAEIVFDIERTIDLCIAKGILAAEERSRWPRAAREASQRGEFLALLCIFTVLGSA